MRVLWGRPQAQLYGEAASLRSRGTRICAVIVSARVRTTDVLGSTARGLYMRAFFVFSNQCTAHVACADQRTKPLCFSTRRFSYAVRILGQASCSLFPAARGPTKTLASVAFALPHAHFMTSRGPNPAKTSDTCRHLMQQPMQAFDAPCSKLP